MPSLPDKSSSNDKTTIPSVFDHDCERPACADIQQMFHQTTSKNVKKKDTAEIPSIDNIDEQATRHDVFECPVDSSTLGRASWTLLHSIAAWYPNQPTTDDQSQMTNLFHSLAQFYPCSYCASDFQQNIQKHPIKVQSREELCIWLCQQHNKVNQKLGKETFPCTMKQLDERWRKSSDPKCQGSSVH